ncbi:unnamed protein product [Prorocentrum cordatum]|uniref:Uncharacterized protein n=1 Tax=Prorocentrum cordatum TaxID=2364126 RepID=A0ABN9V9H6_9DINO|nr:unnamed protein product [Polarella glacialis]
MPTELWSETRRAATVPRLAGGKRTLGDKEEGHGEEEGEGRGSENRAVVYMPGCAAGLLYSGPEQVPKRNTASRPRLASSLAEEPARRGLARQKGEALTLDSGTP